MAALGYMANLSFISGPALRRRRVCAIILRRVAFLLWFFWRARHREATFMKWFENISISRKLMACLLVVTGFTVVAGVVGLYGMRRVDSAIADVAEKSWSKHYLAGSNNTLQRARISVRDMILGAVEGDTPRIEAAFVRIGGYMALMETYFASFNRTNRDAEMQAALDRGRAMYENELVPIVVGIHEASLSGDLDRAWELLEDCVSVSEVIIGLFDSGMEIAIALTEVEAAGAHDVTTRFFALNIALLGAAMACSLLLAYFLSSRITRNLKSLMRLAQDTSGGNLNSNIPRMPKDEIGELAVAFVSVRDTITALTCELERVSDETLRGMIQARGDEEGFQGAYRTVIANTNRLLENFNKYFDLLPNSIVLFDDKKEVVYTNRYVTDEGFKMLGTKIEDNFPPETVSKLLSGLATAIATGKSESVLVERVSPLDGHTITQECLFIPVFDGNGQVASFMMPGYNLTAIVNAKKKTEKVRAYQESEAGVLTKCLMDGIGQGLLSFDYRQNPHDDDTADAAATYWLISETLRQSLQFIKDYVDDITGLLRQMAHKNFNVRVEMDYIGDFSVIKSSIMSMTDSMSLLINSMQRAADGIDSGSGQVARSFRNFLDSFESQKRTIGEMRSYVSRLGEKTQRNVKGTGDAKNLSARMQEMADEGKRQMEALSAIMEEIKSVSAETTKIAHNVEDIAFQTNLLALNAAVEAARAGEHGKGFSVVADEVRSLANRSAQAAKETSLLLEDSRSRIGTGESMSVRTLGAFSGIVDITAEMGGLISEIAASSDEQAADIDQIRQDLDEIFSMIEADELIARENTSATEQLSAYAGNLNGLIQQFKAKGTRAAAH